MTIHNRDSFLAHITRALNRTPRLIHVKKPVWDYEPQKEVFKDFNLEQLVDVFTLQCEKIHTGLRRTNLKALNSTLKEVLVDHEASQIITSTDPRHDAFKVSDVFNELKLAGKHVHYWNAKIGKENQVIAERADVGITYSDITLAESATVCQFNHADNGRTISLLPQSYIAIIPKSTLVPRLTQAMEKINKYVEKGNQIPSCISFISGPSNSADIEMSLIVGVHGPVKATYILVDDI